MIYKELYKQNQKRILRTVINLAGGKYTPDLNIPLPIEKYFNAMGRTLSFYTDFKKDLPELIRYMGYLSGRKELPSTTEKRVLLNSQVFHIERKIVAIPNSGTKEIPFREIIELAELAIKTSRELLDIFYEEEKSAPKTSDHSRSAFETHISDTRTILSALVRINNFSSSNIAAIANNPNLILVGEAGTGKTHLLCSVAEKRLFDGLPTFIFLGDQITTKNPWQSILSNIGFTDGEEVFLKALNQYAKNKKTRGLIIIDAINETNTKVDWDKLLKIKKYDSLGIVISVRSGFDKICITSKIREEFLEIEHEGYATVEWEAVSKYFTHYGIGMPEVPLLLPDFTNPLFLTIFCKTYKNNKAPIKGHSGFTTIFEDYVIKQGNILLTNLGEPKGRTKGDHKIWDGIMKDFARSMSERAMERVTDTIAKKIVKKHFPQYDAATVLLELERQFLLLKIPNYRGRRQGVAYKFPYQKFSDHLIIRHLLNDYLHKPNAFYKNQPLGRLLKNHTWFNQGLVEALAIQIPERLKGKDLIEVAPKSFKNTILAKQTFLQSLIWRQINKKKGNYVTINVDNALDYINKYINKTHFEPFLNVLLTTATIPDHPFNADFLHRHLIKMTMPKRDAMWLPYISKNYSDEQDSSIERVIHWAWKRSKQYPLSKESVRLTAITLTWFLGSSHRYIRDRSTKALVSVLENNIDVLIELFEMFKEINDLYIHERIFAVAYGCSLRSGNSSDIITLATFVYISYFESGKLPTHFLLRDYARGIVETAKILNPDIHFEDKKINPPYGSLWNETISSQEELEKKYYADEDGHTSQYGDIWGSLMYNNGGGIADFGNYVVNSTIGHWTNIRLGSNRSLNSDEANNKFKKSLSKKQKLAWLKIELAKLETILFLPTINEGASAIELKSRFDENKETISNLENTFSASLSDDQRKFYYEIIEPFEKGIYRDSIRIDNALIQRKIFDEIIELGWRPELFSKFDRSVGYYGRESKKEERIGKKYQWIAFHKVLAELADNFVMRDSYNSDQFIEYEGPWQVSERDIDPSCLLDPVTKIKSISNSFTTFTDWKSSLTNEEWGKLSDDFPISKKVGFHTDAKGNKWCILKGYFGWEQPPVPGEDKYKSAKRSIGMNIQTYLIQKTKGASFYKWAKDQNFMGDWNPQTHLLQNSFLREFSRHKAYIQEFEPEENDRTKIYHPDNRTKYFNIIKTNIEYSSGFSSFDASHDDTFHVYLPSKTLCNLLGASYSTCDGVFSEGSNDIILHSGLINGDTQGLLADYKAILAMLKKNNLELFWVIVGQKRILGGYPSYGRQICTNAIMRLEASGNISFGNSFTLDW